MAINLDTIREKSWASVRKLGLIENPSLPLLDGQLELRTQDEICCRLLAMLPCAASAYGFPIDKARRWVEDNERLWCMLTPHEKSFLTGKNTDTTAFKLQVEAMWALAWVLSVSDDLSPHHLCPENFVEMLPDLKTEESPEMFRKKADLRSENEIVAMLDFYYCVHWSLKERYLAATSDLSQLKLEIIEERRRALEWVTGEEDWSELSLDT